jgi:cytochrome b561
MEVLMGSILFAYLILLLALITVLFGLAQFNLSKNQNAKKLAKPLHKVFGYLTVILILVIYVFMVYKLFAGGHRLTGLLAWHAAIGVILFPLIVAKWLVVRPFRGMMKLAPALGLTTFILFFAVVNLGGLIKLGENLPENSPYEPVGGNLSTEDLSGKELIKTKCTRCHDLDRINEAKKTPVEWKKTVERMRDKDPSWISDEEAAEIITALINAPP